MTSDRFGVSWMVYVAPRGLVETGNSAVKRP
jgi:hypothetical protein